MMPGTEMSENKGVLDYCLQYLNDVVSHCCENMNLLTIMSQIKGWASFFVWPQLWSVLVSLSSWNIHLVKLSFGPGTTVPLSLGQVQSTLCLCLNITYCVGRQLANIINLHSYGRSWDQRGDLTHPFCRPWEIMPKASCIMLCQQFLEM